MSGQFGIAGARGLTTDDLIEAFDVLLPESLREVDRRKLGAPARLLIAAVRRSARSDGATVDTTYRQLARAVGLSERQAAVHARKVEATGYWTITDVAPGGGGGITIRINGEGALLPGLLKRRIARGGSRARWWPEVAGDHDAAACVGAPPADDRRDAAAGIARIGEFGAGLARKTENRTETPGSQRAARPRAFVLNTNSIPDPVPVPEAGNSKNSENGARFRLMPDDWRQFPLLVDAVQRLFRPLPAKSLECGIFAPLEAAHLAPRSTWQLVEWFRRQLSAARPKFGPTEAELLIVLATASFAYAMPSAQVKKNRVAVFVNAITTEKLGKVLPHLPAARRRLDEFLHDARDKGTFDGIYAEDAR